MLTHMAMSFCCLVAPNFEDVDTVIKRHVKRGRPRASDTDGLTTEHIINGHTSVVWHFCTLSSHRFNLFKHGYVPIICPAVCSAFRWLKMGVGDLTNSDENFRGSRLVKSIH